MEDGCRMASWNLVTPVSYTHLETTTLYAVWAMDENGNHIPDYQESLSMNYDANGGVGSVIDEMTYRVKD